MSLITMRLSLQTFPQTWQDGTLSFNLIVLPVGDPTADPLFGGATPPFAGTPVPLVANLIAGGSVPTPDIAVRNSALLRPRPRDRLRCSRHLQRNFPLRRRHLRRERRRRSRASSSCCPRVILP